MLKVRINGCTTPLIPHKSAYHHHLDFYALFNFTWEPNTIIIESSDIRLARGLDLKKAKWLKAADPFLTKILLRDNSASNSVIHLTSSSPTLAAWFRVYVSKSSGESEPGGKEALCSKPLFLSETSGTSNKYHVMENELFYFRKEKYL